MVQKTKTITDKIAKEPTAEPLAPEAIVGVALGTVVALAEVVATLEEDAVLKMDEVGLASVVGGLGSAVYDGIGMTIIVLVDPMIVMVGADLFDVMFEAADTTLAGTGFEEAATT